MLRVGTAAATATATGEQALNLSLFPVRKVLLVLSSLLGMAVEKAAVIAEEMLFVRFLLVGLTVGGRSTVGDVDREVVAVVVATADRLLLFEGSAGVPKSKVELSRAPSHQLQTETQSS